MKNNPSARQIIGHMLTLFLVTSTGDKCSFWGFGHVSAERKQRWRSLGWQPRRRYDRCRQLWWRQVTRLLAINQRPSSTLGLILKLQLNNDMIENSNLKIIPMPNAKMQLSQSSQASKMRSSIVRIIVKPYSGPATVGTGFVINREGCIATCAHVLLNQENISTILPADMLSEMEREKFCAEYYKKNIQNIDVYDAEGLPLSVKKVAFHCADDIGLIQVHTPMQALSISSVGMEIGEDVYSCGFPFSDQCEPSEWPYAFSKGYIMNKATMIIGGYGHRNVLRAFMPALSGASGSPICTASGEVVGILNGQLSWGSDKFLFQTKDDKGYEQVIKDFLFVPLPYAYITPVSIMMSRITELLEKANRNNM